MSSSGRDGRRPRRLPRLAVRSRAQGGEPETVMALPPEGRPGAVGKQRMVRRAHTEVRASSWRCSGTSAPSSRLGSASVAERVSRVEAVRGRAPAAPQSLGRALEPSASGQRFIAFRSRRVRESPRRARALPSGVSASDGGFGAMRPSRPAPMRSEERRRPKGRTPCRLTSAPLRAAQQPRRPEPQGDAARARSFLRRRTRRPRTPEPAGSATADALTTSRKSLRQSSSRPTGRWSGRPPGCTARTSSGRRDERWCGRCVTPCGA